MSRFALVVLSLVLAFTFAPSGATAAEKIPVLLISGANNHDWERTHKILRDILVDSGRFTVDITLEPGKTLADPSGLQKYAVFLLDYNGPRWGEVAEKNFITAVRGGTGVSVIHASNNAFRGWVEYETLVGLCWRKGTGHGSFHKFDVVMTDRSHPITRDLPDLKAHPDELYHRLVHMHDAKFDILATAYSNPDTGGTGKDEPMITVANYGKGRVFHTPLGHVWRGGGTEAMDDPQFHNVVIRGTEWAATGDVTESGTAGSLTAAEKNGGWQVLFDGKSSDGWRGFRKETFPQKGWQIEDGALRVVAGGGGGDIVTAEMYENFELTFEWKCAKGANSGIIYRCSEEMGASWQTGPEFQILDDGEPSSDGKNSAGSLYGLYSPQNKVLKPAGEYNRARLVVSGNNVEHWVNGTKVVAATFHSEDWKNRVQNSKFRTMPKFGTVKKGHIALQDHGNDVWYRAIKIRKLERPTVPLFDGRSLEGWTSHLRDGAKMEDVWSVEDGILKCAGKPAGYIRTTADYTNFVLELDWRWDPEKKQAGNSGVLFRMTGEDKVWPRSIEAQLMSGRAGDFWAIGNYPFKTDESRKNGRNTKHTHANENPVGEWNHYRITVDQGDVILEVNGQVLNEATEAEVLAGKICLQSEGAPIHFRNIRLFPIE